jgi:O-antigen/teichoic acid export membrane protein
MLVISAGLYKETKLQSFIQAVIIVILSVILAPHFGIGGVLVASIISNLYRDIDLIFYIPKAVTKLKPTMTIRRVLRIFLLFFLTVLPVLNFMSIKPEGPMQWVLHAIPVAIWAFIVIAGGNILIERKMAKAIVARLRGLFQK